MVLSIITPIFEVAISLQIRKKERFDRLIDRIGQELTLMKQLAIITDDLTSATDCGIQVARSGLDTLVLLGRYEADVNKIEASVISIDTDTRSIPPREAYQIVKKAALQIRADGYKNIYKSMDSTLRGNLGIEIDAVI